jgi:predicted metal-dependent enzyme (double-stranded beta helix superfamily)
MAMATVAPPAVTPTFARLIGEVRAAVRRGSDDRTRAEGAAVALQRYLGHTDLLTPEQEAPDPQRYRQHILHIEPDGSFSIVSLVWIAGQETCIHDHVSWCVVGVHRGSECETRYRLADDGASLVPAGTSTNPTGTVIALTPPGDIHKVANHSAEKAVSLHIYGADIGKLGSSIRRRYDQPVVPR